MYVAVSHSACFAFPAEQERKERHSNSLLDKHWLAAALSEDIEVTAHCYEYFVS